jgi:hypothetical protein
MARDRKVRFNYEFLKYSCVSWDCSALFKRLVTHEKPNSCKGRHAVVIINGPGWRSPVGWHQALLVEVISNVSILKLPQYSPELKPEEQVWSWLRQHHLAVRCLVDQCLVAVTALLNPAQSLGLILLAMQNACQKRVHEIGLK